MFYKIEMELKYTSNDSLNILIVYNFNKIKMISNGMGEKPLILGFHGNYNLDDIHI